MMRLISRTENVVMDGRAYVRLSDKNGPAECWLILSPLVEGESTNVALPGDYQYRDLERAYSNDIWAIRWHREDDTP